MGEFTGCNPSSNKVLWLIQGFVINVINNKKEKKKKKTLPVQAQDARGEKAISVGPIVITLLRKRRLLENRSARQDRS